MSDHSEHTREAEDRIIHDVQRYGCHIAMFEADDYLPPFAYTIGLYETFQHAEIICFGLPLTVMHPILNHAFKLVQSGETLEHSKYYDGFLEGYKVQFLPVSRDYYANYTGYASWYYDRGFEFPMLQLVWPDKEHHFPWEDTFTSAWKFKQPLLDRNSDFKFYEEKNIGVYTTRQALEGDPILYVYHNPNGDWQFHTSLEPDLADARMVCLEEITKLDPTINEIFYLRYGYWASRKSIGDDWQVEEDQASE